MPARKTPNALPTHIEQLLATRQEHVAAIATIDETLARVAAALGGGGGGRSARGAAAASEESETGGGKRKRRRRRGQFAKTANDMVLEFVQANRNPTSQEINSYWKQEGRNGTADNTLSLMTKNKMLKRVPLGAGIRGSRYSVA